MTNLRYSLLPLLALLAIVASIVVAPSMATAQTAGLDQYVPNPGNHHHSGGGGGGGGTGSGDGGQADAAAPSAGGANSGDGTGGGDHGSGGGGGKPAAPANPTAPPTSAGAAEHSLGTIPFTDYPLTPLLLGVLLLLLAGLIAKLATYLAGRRRQPPSPV